jgi:hypothetical protein
LLRFIDVDMAGSHLEAVASRWSQDRFQRPLIGLTGPLTWRANSCGPTSPDNVTGRNPRQPAKYLGTL